MRNSFVDTMLAWEVPPYIVQAMAGHKNNSITLDVYAATGIDQIIAALEAVHVPNNLSIADATAVNAEHGLMASSWHSDGIRDHGWLSDPDAAAGILKAYGHTPV